MDNDTIKQEIESVYADMAYIIDLADAIRLKLDYLSAKLDSSKEKSDFHIPTLKEMLESTTPKYDDSFGSLNFCWQKIPIRARRVLKHYKIRKPAQLEALTERMIRRVPNVGTNTVEAIRELCDKYGIILKDR